MELHAASAIVTGGASGIGKATVEALAARGARCVVVDLAEDEGMEVAATSGGVFVRADVSDAADIQTAVDAAKELGPLRALVNAAGIGAASRTIGRDGEPMPLAMFERVLQVNLIGTFNCLRLAASAMAGNVPDSEGSRGAIVNVASVAAFDGQIGQAAYSASKGGVVAMTLPIARDLSAVGIRVNTVAPGLIDTPIYGAGPESEAFKARLAGGVVFPHRLGRAAELASMIVELIVNDYMNGETVRVDGAIRMPPK